MPLVYSSIIAFVISLISIGLLMPLAKRIGLIDKPSERKVHNNHIPLIGGIAIFLGFGFALLTLNISLADYRVLIAVSMLLIFIGLLDDFHELSPRAKFMVQIVAGLLTIFWGHNQLDTLGHLYFLTGQSLGYWSIPITVIAIVGVVNAFNMVDGIDGLASGLGFITVCMLGYLAAYLGRHFDLIILSVFGSSLFAFLCLNFPIKKQAKVFLGDAGSMLLGFVLVWFLISLSQGSQPKGIPATMLWLVALPIYDVLGVIIQRILQRRSPFAPDRNHFHHLLLHYFKSPRYVCLVMYSLSILLGIIGILGTLYQVADQLLINGFITIFILYLFINLKLWKKIQKN